MPDVKFSNLYPYTDFHELNLDWVISQVKYWSERVGKSIQKIELTGTIGLVDTYTITYSDGTTSTFDVTNGNGITSIAKTGTIGLVDTYTITLTDGSTTTFEVHNGTASIDPTLTLPDYAADAEVVGQALDALAVEKITTHVITMSATGYTTGFVGVDGEIHTGGSYDNYKYSPPIAVKPGDVIDGTSLRVVTAYNNGVVSAGDGADYVNTYTVPAGINSIIVTVAQAVTTYNRTTTGNTWFTVGDRHLMLPNRIYKTSTFTNGGLYNYILLTLGRSAISKNMITAFECDVVSGTNFEIGFSASASDPRNNRQNVIAVTATKITYNGVDYVHGITITGRLQTILETFSDQSAKFVLMANGETYILDISSYVLGSTLNPYVLADDLVANNCKYTLSCRDLRKKIWIFGDSYLSYNTARWRYYLHSFGYDDNVLINAHSGANSTQAITALTNLIAINRPDFIIWATGMNDGSDQDASTPSTTWATGRDNFLSICASEKITPVFCTIPNVPTVSNVGKNSWIRSSGYRYIDLCAAVGADSTPNWLGDMLSNDNVHPSETGAKSLFAKVVSDFPEITINI